MKKIASMRDLYVNLLQDTYNSEKQLLKALPKMAKASMSQQLKSAFESHEEETLGQVERLEEIFALLDMKAGGEPCEATEGLVQEAEDFIAAKMDAKILDAALIASAQKAEHYEIASYGTLCEFARVLGLDDHVSLLEKTLAEEKSANDKLTALAESGVNRTAQAA